VGQEIERKFLVSDDGWRAAATSSTPMRQGYLASDENRTVRVRVAGDRAFVTIKGRAVGLVRPEFEYEIPAADGEALMALCLPSPVVKTRHLVPHAEHVWEVDVFEGANAGLIVAEVELQRADERVDLPSWVGDEVSHESRYTNARLAAQPWAQWEHNAEA
jgi:adenylate cyclase